MKRILSVALVLCLIGTLFVGSVSAFAEEKLPLRYYMPGSDKLIDYDVIAAVNEKMAADGLNIDLQPIYIPWDAWVDKINMMLATGEEFELFQIMCDYIPFSTYQGRGSLAPLDDLIAEYAPELLDRFSQEIWDCTKIDGSIYVIPAEWRDSSGDAQTYLNIRQDKLDAAGLTIDDATLDFDATLMETLEQLQASWGGSVTPYVWDHSKTRPPVPFHRTYDSWPFHVSLDGIFHVDQDGKVQAHFETEEFKMDSAIYADMYNRGLIPPDILATPQDTKNTLSTNGDVLLGLETFDEGGEPGLQQRVPGADIRTIITKPDKPALMVMPLLNANAIPATTKHPEVGVQFLNWLYGSKENHDLLIYGFEGVHYEKIDDTYIKTTYSEAGEPIHRFDHWMIGKRDYSFFEEGIPQFIVDDWNGSMIDYVVSPVSGFNFNSEPVKVEFAQVQAEYDAVILPIKLGVVSYEENIDAALAQMKAAGIDTVIAEYQAQLDAYTAAD